MGFKGLTNHQLETILSADAVARRGFLGVFTADELPPLPRRRPVFFVANTDVAAGPGQHWVAFYYPSGGEGARPEFFDSAGHPPDYYRFDLKKRDFIHNDIQLQASSSYLCGAYVLYYLFWRVRGKTMKSIVHDFDRGQRHANDQKVAQFVQDLIEPLI